VIVSIWSAKYFVIPHFNVKMIKEVPVENILEALNAVKNGANRIELCEHLLVGGTTPSYGTIKVCQQRIDVPVMVMIRPRGGDFHFSPMEIDAMKEDIEICRSLKVEGIVTGVLDKDCNVDVDVMKELIALARPMKVTFHKAIDASRDPYETLKTLIDLGVDRILTSGQADNALSGRQNILRMLDIAKKKVEIIVSGKIDLDQFDVIQQMIPAREFHGRAIVGPLTGDAIKKAV
jgi:copper homeostasis protein